MASISRTINRNKKRQKAVLYARYSSANQREESIDAQLRAMREHCKAENIEIIAEFTDEAVSGKSDNRGNFQKMINQLLKGHLQADFVLVHKFNRFARNKYDSALYKKKLKDIGVKVISVTQKIDDTPEGELLEGFLETIDQYYSANLAVEVRKGLKENALKGKHAGGQVLFGYSLDEEGYYVPNKNAEIVKRIFEEYAAGYPKTVICERLNKEGHRNQRGKKFNTRTLSDLLRNEKYIGNYVYTIDKTETIRLDGIIKDHPIDRKLWNKVQELCDIGSAKGRERKNRKNDRPYLLTGKTFCTICGSKICGSGSKRSGAKKDGKLNYYYKCVGRTNYRNGCQSKSLNKEVFEPKVLKAVLDVVMDKDRIKQIAKVAFVELETMRDAPVITTAQLKKELSEILTMQKKLVDLYLSDNDMTKSILDQKNEEISKRKYEIEEELEKRKYIDESENITEEDIVNFILESIEKIKNSYDQMDDEFMRDIFNTFIERVDVDNEKITIHIRMDFSNFDLEGDNEQLSGVLHSLPTSKVKKVLKRKQHVHARNNGFV